MGDRAALMRELDLLEKVQGDLASIASRTDAARKQDLIRLRKALADQIAAVGKAADALLASTSEQELMREFRNRFSHMRSTTALHQAHWPAVRLDDYVDEYRASAKTVRETNRAFIAWARGAVTALNL